MFWGKLYLIQTTNAIEDMYSLINKGGRRFNNFPFPPMYSLGKSAIRNVQQSMSQSIASKVAMHAPLSAHCT